MKTHNAPQRSHGRPVPYQTGVLPKDFVQRLNRLKKACGLTWNGFARALGVDKKQMLRWRQGTEPCGGAYHSLVSLAPMIPEGVDILMADGMGLGHLVPGVRVRHVPVRTGGPFPD